MSESIFSSSVDFSLFPRRIFARNQCFSWIISLCNYNLGLIIVISNKLIGVLPGGHKKI
ncbi:hypothetical protein ACFL35_06565 [Candidatus Riflebacteria bacterium]